jgi:hypothetical protein
MTSDHLSVCPQYPLSALYQLSPTTAKGEVKLEFVELREGTHVTRDVIFRSRTRSRSGSKALIRQLLDLTANSSTRAQTNLHITGYSQTFDLTQSRLGDCDNPNSISTWPQDSSWSSATSSSQTGQS